MADLLEQLTREKLDEIIRNLPPEYRLRGLSPQQRLEGLSPEERLEGLSNEDLLAALPPERREALLRRLKDNGWPANPG